MASGGKLVIFAALGGNLAIAVTKFAAALFAGSSSMLTEGIHSLVDTGDQLLMLYGRHRSRIPPDARHPLGHGRELYFWGFIVALFIFAGGAGVSIYEGLMHIRHPEMLRHPWVNYGVLGAASVFESISLFFAVREFLRRKPPEVGLWVAFRESKDPAVFVVMMEDLAALAGLAVAAGFIGLTLLTGNPLWDGIGSIVIGLILASVAALLAHECKLLLIGERARPRLHDAVRDLAARHRGVCAVNEVIAVHLAPKEVIATASLDFDDSLAVGELEALVEQIERDVRRDYPEITRLFIRPQSRRAARAEQEALTHTPASG